MDLLKSRKVALIGTGAVGTSFLYSAVNTGLAEEYVLIDMNEEFAKGQALDLEDAGSYSTNKFSKIYAGKYSDLRDADIVVVTAGTAQKPGQTRLEMVEVNAKIMKDIALKIKASGFKGITVVASNPVDVMAAVFQKVSGCPSHKVISSGTSLDTSRLRVELAKSLNVNASAVKAYILGEHGDSSAPTFSAAAVGLVPLMEFAKSKNITEKDLYKIHENVWKKAYEIISRKKATHFGIGVALNKIAKSIITNENSVMSIGAKLEGQYGAKDIYVGTPCVIGKTGVTQILEVPLNKKENEQLQKSIKILKEATDTAFKAIK